MLPTMVRWRVRSTHSSTTCPSSSTAMRDSCLVALMTISRDIRSDCRLRSMPLTLYFAGAISGGRADVGHYREIVRALEADGHRVLAGAVAAEHVGAGGEALTACDIFDRELDWLAEADMLVAEVMVHYTVVGIGIATRHCRF